MQRILIVEDDMVQIHALSQGIHTSYPSWIIDCAQNYQTALDMIGQSLSSNNFYSLFLLDVMLSPEDSCKEGFQLAEEIRRHSDYYTTPLLFLTSVPDHNYFALSHFHCYNYIEKSYTIKDILRQLQQMLITGYLNAFTLSIKDCSQILYHVCLSDVLYIQASNHHVIVHMKDACITSRSYSMDELTDMTAGTLLRCHRRFLINPFYVQSYDRTTRYAILDTERIPVGKVYKDAFENKLQHYINGELS